MIPISLDGRVAVVTGAGRGIGAAIATALSQAGAAVAVVDIDLGSAQAVADGLSARAYRADVTDGEQVAALFEQVASDLGSCSILVNNAGISRPAPTLETSLETWQAVLLTNLTSAFLCSRSALPAMRDAGWGRIINIASFTAKSSPIYADNASYAASKSGVVGLTHNLAVEFARFGVTVNAIAPGIVDTDLLRGAHSPGRRAELMAKVPLGRFTSPEEVAHLVAFLASDLAGSITGETVNINGGLYLD